MRKAMPVRKFNPFISLLKGKRKIKERRYPIEIMPMDKSSRSLVLTATKIVSRDPIPKMKLAKIPFT